MKKAVWIMLMSVGWISIACGVIYWADLDYPLEQCTYLDLMIWSSCVIVFLIFEFMGYILCTIDEISRATQELHFKVCETTANYDTNAENNNITSKECLSYLKKISENTRRSFDETPNTQSEKTEKDVVPFTKDRELEIVENLVKMGLTDEQIEQALNHNEDKD